MPDTDTIKSLDWSTPVAYPEGVTFCATTVQDPFDLSVVTDATGKQSCYYKGQPLNPKLDIRSVIEATQRYYTEILPFIAKERKKLGPRPELSQQASSVATDAWIAGNDLLTRAETFADRFKNFYELNLASQLMPVASAVVLDCAWRQYAKDCFGKQEPTEANQTDVPTVGSSHGQQ